MRTAVRFSLGSIATSAIMLTAGAVPAAIIAETSGANDPALAGFVEVGLPGEPGTDTEDHWLIHQPFDPLTGVSSKAFMKSLTPATDLQDPSGWTATVRVRSDATGGYIQNTHVQVTDATDAWVIGLLDNGPEGPGAYVWTDAYLAGARISGAAPSGYHTYQMIYDPVGDGGNGVVSFWIDGINTGVQQTRADVSPDGPNRFIVGGNSGSGGAEAESRWSLVRFETGQHPIPPIAQAGDFDGDGDVDGADFVVWQTNFPTASDATLADGDADGDGDVDGADFVVWQTNFPTTPGPGVAAVPEPMSLCLALFGGLIATVWHCRSR